MVEEMRKVETVAGSKINLHLNVDIVTGLDHKATNPSRIGFVNFRHNPTNSYGRTVAAYLVVS